MPDIQADNSITPDGRKVYSSEGEIPEDAEGRIDSISFDGVTAPVTRSAGHEAYFTLSPPDGAPSVCVPQNMRNEEVIAFIKAHIASIRDMRTDMQRHYERGSSRGQRYETGEVAYVLGRPFMVRAVPLANRGQIRRASRGRASTRVAVDAEAGLVELHVIQTGDYDQRRGTFLSWAAPILARNASNLCPQAARRAGIDEDLPSKWRVTPMRSQLVRLDRDHDTVWISEDLVPYPARCLVYAFMRALADEAFADSILPDEQRKQEMLELVAAGCPEHEQARIDLVERRYF